MSIVNISRRTQFIDHDLSFHHTETITTGATGNVIIIPPIDSGRSITCTLIAGANTGKFQVTTSSDESVTAGTATWQDWALGTQTGTVSDSLTSPVTAVRGVSVSGAIVIEIVI